MIERTFKRVEVKATGERIFNLLSSGIRNEDNEMTFMVKGVRGWVNHSIMSLAKQEGIEVCNAFVKEGTQTDEEQIEEGFHRNGSCYPEEECIKHKLMGSTKKMSKLRFEPVLVSSKTTKDPQKNSQTVFQEHGRNCFSGEFTIKIEFGEELSKEELGFLLKALEYAPNLRLGTVKFNDSGKVTIHSIELQEVTRSRWIDKTGKVFEKEVTHNLLNETEEGRKTWPPTSK